MKIVISPAKTINETSPLPTERYSSAIFTKEIAEVHGALQPLSPQKLSALMSISPKLAELNWQRNQVFTMPLTPQNARPALFAYDGDADRCLAVDENGNVVDGDGILYVCGKYMKENSTLLHNTVVTTVMSNFGLYKAFDRDGIAYEKTQVGDKYVYENMSANGHCLGGEQSGHIIFSKNATTGDGILTSLKIMEVMLEKKETLGKLVSEYKVFPQVLKNIRVTDKEEAVKLYPVVQKMLDKLAKTNIIHQNKAANLKSALCKHVAALG